MEETLDLMPVPYIFNVWKRLECKFKTYKFCLNNLPGLLQAIVSWFSYVHIKDNLDKNGRFKSTLTWFNTMSVAHSNQLQTQWSWWNEIKLLPLIFGSLREYCHSYHCF